ncbi:MAG: hypothetical protein U9Q68_05750 [Euryarchaeota archaeon]|nr:hypothetical protein [Euryarchaeota archaeon]
MNIGEITEKLIRKIKGEDEMGIELEIEDLLSDEEEPDEGLASESAGGWVQTIDDADNEEPSFEDDSSDSAKGEEGEESDEWIQQDDDKTDLQAFGQGGVDTTEDTLLTELKMDDELDDSEDHEILEYLEATSVDELVAELRRTVAELKRGKK